MAPKKRTRKTRPTRAKRPRVTIKVTAKALLPVIVIWLTVVGASPSIVGAFIR